jgi:hypothetical protein
LIYALLWSTPAGGPIIDSEQTLPNGDTVHLKGGGQDSHLTLTVTSPDGRQTVLGLLTIQGDEVVVTGGRITDTGGATDHVFGLFALLGQRFAPRLRDLKDWRFYSFERGGEAYPALKRHLGGIIDASVIREAWDELLRLAASIEARTAAPSTLLKKLAGYPKQNQIARALREVGRIERTLFMAEWYSDPGLRRRCQVGLNKGEAGHKLKRAVFFHERGEVRDRSFESQAFRASGVNLTVAAIVYWNTVYLSRAAADLRQRGQVVDDALLRHVSPQTWEHITLTGTYTWSSEPLPPETFRPLRDPAGLGVAA